MGSHGYRKVPARFIVTGDINRGRALIGAGRKQLGILEDIMMFQGLKVHHRTVRLDDRTVIACYRQHNLSEVHIHVEPVGGGKEELKETEECFCVPCMAVAKILAVHSGYGDTTESLYSSTRPTYDIEMCREWRGGGYTYHLFERFGIGSAGWEVYREGQYVTISVNELFSPSGVECCYNEDCLLSTPDNVLEVDKIGQISNLFVTPITVKGKMKKWVTRTKYL